MKTINSEELTSADIPRPFIWQSEPSIDGTETIWKFAYTFNGYEAFGDDCGELANQVERQFKESGQIPADLSLDELRNALFFYHRAARHGGFDYMEHREETLYVNTLLDEIRMRVKT